MDCFERLLLNGCYRATYNPRNPTETRRAILICALLPNHRSLCDFQDAMYLLEANNNKATVLFSWQELKERQSSRLLHQLVALVHAQGHEIALHFNTDLCMQSELGSGAACSAVGRAQTDSPVASSGELQATPSQERSHTLHDECCRRTSPIRFLLLF